ncbi:MAG: GDSL-type esterase/lipase family protein [Ilumatobacteraceae bacterium]
MNMLSRRSLITAGLGLVAGCSTTKTYAGPEGAEGPGDPGGTNPGSILGPDGVSGLPLTEVTSIAMVGDSITEGSADELEAAFADEGIDDVVIDGESSRRIKISNSSSDGPGMSGVNAVKALLDSGADPTVWVIALGTNDVGSFGTPQECADLIEEITTLLPPPAHLIWVNVYRPLELRQTKVFNEVLESVIEARGAAVVADWYAIATDPEHDVLRDDEIHPNDSGQVAFAELVVQALQRL